MAKEEKKQKPVKKDEVQTDPTVLNSDYNYGGGGEHGQEKN